MYISRDTFGVVYLYPSRAGRCYGSPRINGQRRSVFDDSYHDRVDHYYPNHNISIVAHRLVPVEHFLGSRVWI